MGKKRYETFEGLTEEGFRDTVDQYASAGWSVHSMGINDDGYWVFLELDVCVEFNEGGKTL